MPKALVALGLAAMLAMPTSVFAADHQVLMLNKDSEGHPMQFEPAFLKVAPGDTVTFVAPKAGFENPAAQEWLGEVHVVGIGAPKKLIEQFGAAHDASLRAK